MQGYKIGDRVRVDIPQGYLSDGTSRPTYIGATGTIKAPAASSGLYWGTLDEQHTLPFGTPQDVEYEVIHRLEHVGHDGGLILAPTHHVQLDTPLANFWAMVDSIVNTPYSSLK